MPNQDVHFSDQEMLLAVDGELSSRRAAEVRAHLIACRGCRSRMEQVEGTSAAFARAYQQTLDPRLPAISAPRAVLRARLAELGSQRDVHSRRWLLDFASAARSAAFLGAVVLMAAVAGSFLVHRFTVRGSSSIVAFERNLLPNRSLTPGATRRVSDISDVCSMAHEEVIGEVSTSLRREVFQNYGIADVHASDYEVDYLIPPGLGGEEAIRNLWPEPYTSGMWNAHVKDDLEERLHEMVCHGELDLSAAQRDIATDWIAAYKKYFHTDRPLALHSRLSSVNCSILLE
jgi:hypothetical protein